MEVTESCLDNLSDLMQVRSCRERIICTAGHVTERIRTALFRNGIADLWPSAELARLGEYLGAISGEDEKPEKTILVLEKDPSVMRIISTITGRFGYRARFFDSAIELCSATGDPDAECVLINLGCEENGTAGLVKALHGKIETKSRPFIAYRDMSLGVSVSELMNGLNRITRVVLSREELYSFLAEILPRKQIMTMIMNMGNALDSHGNRRYTCETLGQVYFQEKGDVFDDEGFLCGSNVREMLGLNSRIRQALLRAEGLSWMKMRPEQERVNISEVDG